MVGDRPYWRDVGTLDAYWEANLDLTHVVPELNLYDEAWPMLGRQPHRPPAKFVFDDAGRRGIAVDSLVSDGCIVSGAAVRRSILFYSARVGEGSVVEDSVVLPDAQIGRDVRAEAHHRRQALRAARRPAHRLRPGQRPRALQRHRARRGAGVAPEMLGPRQLARDSVVARGSARATLDLAQTRAAALSRTCGVSRNATGPPHEHGTPPTSTCSAARAPMARRR